MIFSKCYYATIVISHNYVSYVALEFKFSKTF